MARKAGSSKANQQKIKKALIELLQKTPIVQSCCKKVGIVRSTYYRWYNEDHVFRAEAEEALELSCDVVNDIAESKLIEGVRNGEFRSLKYWLEHNHEKYMPSRLETTKGESSDGKVVVYIPTNGREAGVPPIKMSG